MSIKIETFTLWGGSPKWFTDDYHAGYLIQGQGFGRARGTVTIDGHPQKILVWTQRKIKIAIPRYDIYWSAARAPRVVVTTAARRRGPEFMAIPPMWNDGSIAPVKEISYRRAA